MNRKQFFGNMVGLVGVAANAKELSSLDLDTTAVPIVVKELSPAYSRVFVSAIAPFLDTREINKMVTDMYNQDLLKDILK